MKPLDVSSLSRFLLASCVLTPCLWGASTAAAQEQDPDAVFLEAARAYGDEDYATAAELFARAYALRPETSLLLNRGLACERAGMVAEAIAAYEQYLEEAPDADERPDVERSLETLRRQHALEEEMARREAEAEANAARAEAPAAAPAPAASDAGPPSGPAPWVVTALGAAAVIAGAILGGIAQGRYDSASNASSGVEARDLEGEANDLALGANVLFGVGGGVALLGLTWGIIELAMSGTSDEAPPTVSLGPLRWSLQ